MAPGPPTCDICGAMISGDVKREAEPLFRSGADAPVLVHKRCRGRRPYAPEGNAKSAYEALDDPVEQDADFWVTLRNVEASRRHGDTDYIEGLRELVERGWAEADDIESRFRLSPTGRSCRRRVFPEAV